MSGPEKARKPLRYTLEQRDLALAFLSACRGGFEDRIKDAARRTKIPEDLIRAWHEGRDDKLIGIPAGGLVVPDDRPMPPEWLVDEDLEESHFVPAYDLMAWMKGTFIDDSGPLYNEEYWHLTDAKIGVLWTNVPNAKGGMRIVGTAELIQTKGSRWTKGRELFILRNWFGEIPDFVITLDALYCHEADDYTFCGTCEHELSHCGIKVNRFGEEVFDPDDNPVFALRAHDAEEFVHVVARYGVGAAAGKVAELVRAANSRPLIGEGQMRAACGNCIR